MDLLLASIRNRKWLKNIKNQSAFNNIHNETSVLKSLFYKVAGLLVYNLIKKKLRCRCFPVSFPNFLRRPILLHLNRCLNEMNRKQIVFTKSIHKNTPGKTSLLVQLEICGLTAFQNGTLLQMSFFENCHSFTEHCCVTASDFL